MKIKVIGNYMHIIMNVSVMEMKKAGDYKEDSLFVFEENNGERVPCFGVKAGIGISQSLSKYGAHIGKDCVVNEGNEYGENSKVAAQIDVELPPMLTKDQYSEYITDHYGEAINYLKTIESQVMDALNERGEKISGISNLVEFENLNNQ